MEMDWYGFCRGVNGEYFERRADVIGGEREFGWFEVWLGYIVLIE